MKIGELGDKTGVDAETIRYYERERLLPEAPRLDELCGRVDRGVGRERRARTLGLHWHIDGLRAPE